MSWLRVLTERGAERRYGRRGAEQVPGAYAQIDHELAMIEQLGFPGYFLIVWDIVEFCRRNDIFCQGRGSAANSAVCYALGVTNADAVKLGLLFERFLSPERDGPPDIDVDIESDRREEAIQYVYGRYGREKAAQVANVITYRSRSAVRDMGKALGHAQGRSTPGRSSSTTTCPLARAPALDGHPRPRCVALAAEVQHFPRHLGIHSGGMVLCDRPVVEVCPVEWGRMEDRTVLQWDKDDCAAAGLVKFDLLGPRDAVGPPLLRRPRARAPRRRGRPGPAARRTPRSTRCSSEADSVGVFQVESRAQMATLPRLKPRTFYDLVVEVALIRPGPIQGGSVHPYIRRRNGQEPVTYLHPLLEPAWPRRSGCRCSRSSSCRWPSTWPASPPARPTSCARPWARSGRRERMERLQARLYEGMAERGITGDGGRRDLRQAGRLRQLRLPREPLGELRLPRLRLVVAEAALPGRLLRRPAQRPAHGVLGAPHPGARRPPPRGARAPARREPQRPAVRPRARRAQRRGRGGAARRRGGALGRRRPGRAHRRRPALRLDGGPGPAHGRRASAGARGAGHGRGLRARSGSTAAAALWAAGACAQGGEDRLAGVVTGSRRRRCRA